VRLSWFSKTIPLNCVIWHRLSLATRLVIGVKKKKAELESC